MTLRAGHDTPRPGRRAAAAATLLGALGVCLPGCATALKDPPPLHEMAGGGDEAEPVEALLARAEDLFARRADDAAEQAARLWLRAAAADPRRTEGLIGAARAEVWRTEHLDDPRRREMAAVRAVQAAQWCGRVAPSDPACDYWLGAALGVQARERATTALSALPQIEAAFGRAALADPTLEEAGPDRALALMYLRAPGWPAGPGDPETGLTHARRAVALRPDHPPNQMALGEALAATGDREGSRAAYRLALDLARRRLGEGDADAPEWAGEAARALSALGGN